MTTKILVTGASGCVGHYIAAALASEPNVELFLLVRDPAKFLLPLDWQRHHLVQGSLEDLDSLRPLLAEINAVVHTATAWGDVERAQRVNVTQTMTLFQALSGEHCQKIIYFSTASVLDRHNKPLPIAAEAGTEYIRTKYEMLQRRRELPLRDRLITLFPTLVFGGSPQHSYSQIALGLAEVKRYITILRFLTVDAAFHVVHAADIALVVKGLLQMPTLPEERDLVLGVPAVSVNEAITTLCYFFRKRIYFQIPIPVQPLLWLAPLLRIQLSSWDRHCLNDLHFTHRVTRPEDFGQSSRFGSLKAVLADFLPAPE